MNKKFDRQFKLILQSLYDDLGVSKDASQDEIKQAYRKLAIKWHPDKNNGSEQSTQKFKEINNAYSILSNDQKRKKYDKEQAHEVPPMTINVEKKREQLEHYLQKFYVYPEFNKPQHVNVFASFIYYYVLEGGDKNSRIEATKKLTKNILNWLQKVRETKIQKHLDEKISHYVPISRTIGTTITQISQGRFLKDQ